MTEQVSLTEKVGLRGHPMLQAAMLVGVFGAAAPQVLAANINFDFNADIGEPPGEILLHQVDENVAPSPGETRRDYQYNQNGALPLSTIAAIGLTGKADWREAGNKSLGVSATLDGRISSFDVNHPPPPHQGLIQGTIKAHVDAVVTIAAAGAAIGDTVTFNLLNPSIHGSLITPATDVNGSGFASISGLFVMFEYSEDFFGNRVLGASKAKAFEEIASTNSGRPNADFAQGGQMALLPVLEPGAPPPPVVNANPDFTVRNGSQYFLVLELTATTTLQPTFSQNGSESPNISSSANFGSTVHWGGFGDFTGTNGAPLQNVRLLDESGVDWVTPSTGYPVPLPPALGLLLAGMGCLARRRRVRPA